MWRWFVCRSRIRFVCLSQRLLGVMMWEVCIFKRSVCLVFTSCHRTVRAALPEAFPLRCIVCLRFLCVAWFGSKNFTFCCLGMLVLVLFSFTYIWSKYVMYFRHRVVRVSKAGAMCVRPLTSSLADNYPLDSPGNASMEGLSYLWPAVPSTFARANQWKSSFFSCFFSHLFVPLQPQSRDCDENKTL